MCSIKFLHFVELFKINFLSILHRSLLIYFSCCYSQMDFRVEYNLHDYWFKYKNIYDLNNISPETCLYSFAKKENDAIWIMINIRFRGFGDLFCLTAGVWRWRFISGDCMIVSEMLHITDETFISRRQTHSSYSSLLHTLHCVCCARKV